MRIAEFGHKHVYESTGGIEVVVTELVKRLAEHGNTVTVFDRREIDRPERTYPKTENVRLLCVPTLSNSKINAQLYSLGATLRCLLDDYDVVQVHAEGPAVFIPLLKASGKKVVVTIHGLDWQRAKWGRFASAYIKLGERMTAHYADRIVVLSDDVKSYFRDAYGRDADLVINGVTVFPTTDTNLIAPFGLERGNYFLFIGRMVPEKRLDLLVNAYLRSGTKKKLVISGEITDAVKQSDWYPKAIANPNVVFTGFAEGALKAQLYSNAHCFVLPSDIEGMSIALLEGLGYGIRVLASDIEENVRIMHGFGDTFSAGDMDALAGKLSEISALPFLRSKAQYDYIHSEYSWDKAYEEYFRILEEAARNGRK